MATPNPASIIGLMQAFQKSQVLFVATSIGVFDCLERSPAGVATIAADLNVSPDGLERLLDTCVGLGLLQKDPNGKYANTAEASAYICRSSSTSIASMILHYYKRACPLFGNLENAVRESGHRYRETLNTCGNMFEIYFKDPIAMRGFLLGLHSLGSMSSPNVVAAVDLGPFNRMVDVGGGCGHLSIAACERYKDLFAAVFELPQVAVLTREIVSQSGPKDRIEVLEGDFFEDDLPNGDLYAFCRVLHDWTEEKIIFLLKKVVAKLPPGGGILIAERFLDESKTGPLSSLLTSLCRLVATEGKERTPSELEALLRHVGFDDIRLGVTGVELGVMLAVKH